MAESVSGARKRILVVTKNFPPSVGGIQRYLHEILVQLAREYDVALCGPVGSRQFVPDGTPVFESSLEPMPAYLVKSLFNGARLARRFDPDLVIGGSGLMAPHVLAIARQRGVPAAVFVYGLDLVVDNFFYRNLWLPTIRACDAVIPISRATRTTALECGVAASRLCDIVHPGTSAVVVNADQGAAFRSHHALGKRPLLLSVGRLVARKGIVEFVERCLPAIVKRRPDAVLVVIGGESVDSLKAASGSLAERAQAIARANGLSDNLLMLGETTDEALLGAWNAADVHVFPGRAIAGDMEGFGMVCIEAAAHGVPTVAFNVGGVADAVAPGRSGVLIEPEDYAAMSSAVLERLSGATHDAQARAMAIGFAAEFSWEAIGQTARRVVADILVTH